MRPFVRVVGASLLAGCTPHSREVPTPPAPLTTMNPPGPDPVPPDASLPTFDEVPSGHPPGATNPPYPLLVVAGDTHACFKTWFGGMVPTPARERAAGGRVVDTEGGALADGMTKVQCPEGQPTSVLAAWAASEPEAVVPEPGPTANPPPPVPLPTWDEAASGHPPGATNPPYPVLIAVKGAEDCYKTWVGPRLRPSPQEQAAGGRVLGTTGELPEEARQVQCPEGQPAALFSAWEAAAGAGPRRR